MDNFIQNQSEHFKVDLQNYLRVGVVHLDQKQQKKGLNLYHLHTKVKFRKFYQKAKLRQKIVKSAKKKSELSLKNTKDYKFSN